MTIENFLKIAVIAVIIILIIIAGNTKPEPSKEDLQQKIEMLEEELDATKYEYSELWRKYELLKEELDLYKEGYYD